MKLHANLAAAWLAMPRHLKVGCGAELTMSLMKKYDESAWSHNRAAYDAVVDALPKNMGSKYYMDEVVKICDDEDRETLKDILAELEEDD